MNINTPKIKKKPLYATSLLLLASIIAHIGVIALISLMPTTDKPSHKGKKEKQRLIVTLNSYMLSAKPKAELIEPTKNIQNPDDISPENKIENAKIIGKVNSTSINSETLPQTNPATKPVASHVAAPIDASKIEKALKPSVTNDSKQAATIIRSLPSDFDEKYGKLVTKHLAGYHAAYSRQQAQEFRKLKTSPIIDTSSLQIASDDDLQPPVLNVDCTNTAKKILAGISSLTKGTLNCNSNDEFQYYIDKRLNPLTKNTLDSVNKD